MTVHSNPWDLSRSGPLIVLASTSGEFVATLQVAYRQDGQAFAVITTWEIDSDVTCRRLRGGNEDWPKFWEAFLDMLPPDWQAAVAHCELQVRF